MKKNNVLKAVAFSLASVMLFSACQPSKPKTTTTTTPAQAQSPTTALASEAPKEGMSKDLISDKPIELTAHIHWSTYVLSDEWTILKEAGKMTNIYLKGTSSTTAADAKEAFNLMIASKNIPDIVGGERDSINQYGTEGAFIPLNDLIEKNAPNIKSYLDANPDVKGAITAADGNIYQIPFAYETLISEAWFIREDWLNKVGKEVPKTVDELHSVLTSFANDDPNGNGKKDEIGLFSRIGAGDNSLKSLLSLYGINDGWHLNKDNKVQWGLAMPEYKEAIKSTSKWYSEGLIDKEIFTRGGKSRDILFPENNGGVIHDWIPSTSGYNVKIKDTIPDFKLIAMLPPVDINGDQWELASRAKLDGRGWAISKGNKYPNETMKYMNFWWTDEGRRLSTYGIEGEHYIMKDGKPVYTDTVLKASTPINDFIRKLGGQIDDIAYLHDASYESFMTDPEGVKASEMYEKANVVNKMNINLPALSYTESELKLITSKEQPIRTFMLEQLQKWTFDGSKIDAEFDPYMASLKNMGIDELIAAKQAAYDRLMK